MMIRKASNFRRFIDSNGLPIYMTASASCGKIFVRLHKAELIKSLTLLPDDTHVAYRPGAHYMTIYAIGSLGICEGFDA